MVLIKLALGRKRGKRVGVLFKGVVDCDFTFLMCVMLLFEHKQYLQSYKAERSMQMEISSFKIITV